MLTVGSPTPAGWSLNLDFDTREINYQLDEFIEMFSICHFSFSMGCRATESLIIM